MAGAAHCRGACSAVGGSARSAPCLRPPGLPRSLPGGPAIRWSPDGGGGRSSLRLGWSGRPPRWWIGPGRTAARAATRRERAARGRPALIRRLIGGGASLWSPAACGGGREPRPGARLRRTRRLSSWARVDLPWIRSPHRAGTVPPAGTVRRRRLSALSSAALSTSRRSRAPRPPRRVGVLPELDARPVSHRDKSRAPSPSSSSSSPVSSPSCSPPRVLPLCRPLFPSALQYEICEPMRLLLSPIFPLLARCKILA